MTETKEKPQKNIIKSTIEIIVKLICLIIVIFSIVFIVRALVYQKYDVFGYRFYMIMSGSMEPTIHIGDAVISKETSELQEGDIIAFQTSDSITVHRVVKTYTEGEKKLYQTKGDANNAEDKGLLQQDQIKGKIILKIPKTGTIILFLQRNYVPVVICIVAIILVIALVRRLM